MRPHLVRLNSTITSEAQWAFNIILILEILIMLFIVIGGPLLCISISRIGSIHRNFRCQICLAMLFYLIGIAARIVLIVYQLFDLPVTDRDPVLLIAELARDISICYYSGLPCCMVVQTLVGTYYWQWYEKGSWSTSFVLLFSETANIILASINAAIWLLGFTAFAYNIGYNYLMQAIGVYGFAYTYHKNARQLEQMTKDRISYGNYTVDRSFQVRENVFQMKYIVKTIVPAALVSSPCYLFFAFNEYGPKDWVLSRGLAYAAWDLFFAIFRAVYLYLEIKTHPQIWREFNNLVLIRMLPKRRKNTISEESIVTKTDLEMTQSYFNQFAEAWA